MRVFVTGATGFVGSAIVRELVDAGHSVMGLVRSDAGAAAVTTAGALAQHGDLRDLESLRTGADWSDAVIHTAYIHDFSKMEENGAVDRLAIETLGAVLTGSSRALVVTSGMAFLAPGRVATEQDMRPFGSGVPRVSEQAAAEQTIFGVRAFSVRLPPSVHGEGDHGFVPRLIALAREKGVSAYIGEGLNRWPAVHRLDAAGLYRLIVEAGGASATYHGNDEEGIPFREIAMVIGRRLNLPVVGLSAADAAAHFGWFAPFAAIDCAASSAQTRHRLGWHPTQPGLLADLDHPRYFGA